MLIGRIAQIWRYPVKSMAGERLSECSVAPLGIPGDRGWALRDETTGEITNGKRIPLLMQCAARYREEPANGAIPHVEIGLPDGASLQSDDGKINSHLSDLLGRSVSLWPRQPASARKHYRRSGMSARLVGPLTRAPGFRSFLPQLSKLPNIDAELRNMFGREPDEPVPDISTLPPELIEYTSPPGTYFDAFPIHLLTTASLETMAHFNPRAAWDPRRFRPNFLVETEDEVEGLPEATWKGRTLRVGSAELGTEIPTVRCGMTAHAQAGLGKDPSILRSTVKDADQNLGVYACVGVAGNISVGDQVLRI